MVVAAPIVRAADSPHPAANVSFKGAGLGNATLPPTASLREQGAPAPAAAHGAGMPSHHKSGLFSSSACAAHCSAYLARPVLCVDA